jgi:hypothetical protein
MVRAIECVVSQSDQDITDDASRILTVLLGELLWPFPNMAIWTMKYLSGLKVLSFPINHWAISIVALYLLGQC